MLIASDFFEDVDQSLYGESVKKFHKKLFYAGIIFAFSIITLSIDALISDKVRNFVESARGQLWIFVCGIKTVFAVMAGIYAYSTLTQVKKHFKSMKLPMSFLILALVVLPLFLPLRALIDFPSIAIKFILVTAIAATVVWLSLDAMLFIQRRLERLKKNLDHVSSEVAHSIVSEFLLNRKQLQNLLFICGIIIGLSTLAAACMRSALQSNYNVDIPIEYIIIYGAYFSSVMGIIFFPAYIASNEVAYKILEHYYPISSLPKPQAGEPVEMKWYEFRHHLEDLLKIEKSGNFWNINGFSIFSPILGSLVGIILGIK